MIDSNNVFRGVRNRNPANIRRDKTNWLGLAPIQTDKEFCQFIKFKYGIRALIKVLHTYYFKYHIDSIHGIIYRFAPPTENDCYAYVNFICVNTGFHAYDNLMWYDVVTKVAPAICRFESDYNLTPNFLLRVVKEFNLL